MNYTTDAICNNKLFSFGSCFSFKSSLLSFNDAFAQIVDHCSRSSNANMQHTMTTLNVTVLLTQLPRMLMLSVFKEMFSKL